MLIPAGISILSSSFCEAATTSLIGTPETTVETVMMRSRSLRSIVGGEKRSTTLPTSLIRIAFPVGL